MHVNPLQTTSDNDFIGELSRVCLRQLIMNKVCLSSKDFEECINNWNEDAWFSVIALLNKVKVGVNPCRRLVVVICIHILYGY